MWGAPGVAGYETGHVCAHRLPRKLIYVCAAAHINCEDDLPHGDATRFEDRGRIGVLRESLRGTQICLNVAPLLRTDWGAIGGSEFAFRYGLLITSGISVFDWHGPPTFSEFIGLVLKKLCIS